MSRSRSGDRRFMREAMALATLGEGTTQPNPMVGCVIVRDGEVLGRGWHRRAGEDHAERLALADAGGDVRGATVYLNLEPCAHYGRTAPCSDRLRESGVARVVVALEDPDPRVSGRGLEGLRKGGVEVVLGVEREAAARLNEIFLHAHTRHRPWVSAKLALSFDGRIAARHGVSRWISNDAARRHAHRLRHLHDAIWVGAETLRRDRPRLTVRLPGLQEENRLILSWSRQGALPPREELEETPGRSFRIFLPESAIAVAVSRGWSESELVPMGSGTDAIDPASALQTFDGSTLRSILLEGGGATQASFLAAGCIDRAYCYQASCLIGDGGSTPGFPMPAVSSPDCGYRFVEEDRFDLEDDLLRVGRFETQVGKPACSQD